MKTLKLLVGAGLALVLAACVLKTTRHTVYLEPDGSVVWTVLEEDVHSDARTAVDRRKEECDWLAAVHAGEHGVARGLALLGGDPVSRVLRSERPFVVWTEARFDSFEELATRLVSDLQGSQQRATQKTQILRAHAAFRDDFHRPQLECPDGRGGSRTRVRAHYHDRSRRVTHEALDRLEPIHLRHLDIHRDEIGKQRTHLRECLLPVAGSSDHMVAPTLFH